MWRGRRDGRQGSATATLFVGVAAVVVLMLAVGDARSQVAATPAPAARVVSLFDGVSASSAGAGTPAAPPNLAIAVGPFRLLQVSDGTLMRILRSGAEPEGGAMDRLFRDDTLAPGSTSVAYFDRLSWRGVVASVSGSGASAVLLLGINKGNQMSPIPLPGEDPLFWCNYRFRVKRLAPGPVSIGIGSSDALLVVTINPLQEGARPVVMSFDFDRRKMLEYGYTTDCAPLTAKRLKLPATALGVMPAQHQSAVPDGSGTLFMLSTEAGSAVADTYTLWSVTPRSAGKPRVVSTALRATRRYSDPGPATQLSGPALDSGDGRIAQAVFRDGRLWAVHATGCRRGRNTCIRTLEIDTADAFSRPTESAALASTDQAGAAPAMIVAVRTIGSPGAHYWMPGVAVNRYGDALVTYAASRATEFFGTRFSELPSGEGNFGPSQMLATGQCALGGAAIVRTGLSQSAQVDPFDEIGFWATGAYAASVAGECSWKSRVALVRLETRPRVPPIRLASGQLQLPAASGMSGPGFNQEFNVGGNLPPGLAATAGRRLVLRMSDSGRPTVTCNSEHPLGGCGTVDYSGSPSGAHQHDNFLVVQMGGVAVQNNLSDSLMLVKEPVVRDG